MLKCCIEIGSLAHMQSGRGVACVHPVRKLLESCDLGFTDGHFDISAAKVCIMLKFSGNLGETCIYISSMIMTQLSFFSVSEKGKTSSQDSGGGGMRPPLYLFGSQLGRSFSFC